MDKYEVMKKKLQQERIREENELAALIVKEKEISELLEIEKQKREEDRLRGIETFLDLETNYSPQEIRKLERKLGKFQSWQKKHREAVEQINQKEKWLNSRQADKQSMERRQKNKEEEKEIAERQFLTKGG